ncbi:MAG: hypothetical protein TREMPRED_004476 [Tremellales sp. Tagirdzhanova-0007]|nr:MAG: hypothetical protein TREMPRED_004476 [Tremellales sp. Tagirdzhanova-0007]
MCSLINIVTPASRPVLHLRLLLSRHGLATYPSRRHVFTTPYVSNRTDPANTPLSSKLIDETAKVDETKRTGLQDEPSLNDPLLASYTSPKLFELNNRTIVVTGGGRGLGLTVVHALLEAGASVAALDRLPEPTQPAWSDSVRLAERKGLNLDYQKLDVTDVDDVTNTFASIFTSAPSNQPVRGLFTAAGVTLLMQATDYTPEQFRKVIDINLTGSFLCAQAFGREFMSRNSSPKDSTVDTPGVESEESLAVEGGASIVMVGSMSAKVANLGLDSTAYNASKAGVVQMGRSLASEWSKHGIRVNTLSPGYIRTALTDMLIAQKPEFGENWPRQSLLGRLSTPDEYRGPTIFLLSNASSYMTGADLLVDGGHTAT